MENTAEPFEPETPSSPPQRQEPGAEETSVPSESEMEESKTNTPSTPQSPTHSEEEEETKMKTFPHPFLSLLLPTS